MASRFGRGLKARATKQHTAALPTRVPLKDEERIVAPVIAVPTDDRSPVGHFGLGKHRPMTRDADDRQWFALRVGVKAHRTCYRRLKDLGYGVFLPTETEWVRGTRKGPEVIRERQRFPLGAYLFLGMRDGDSWLPLRETDYLGQSRLGITGIVSAEGRPVAMPVQALADLAALERHSTLSATPHRDEPQTAAGGASKSISEAIREGSTVAIVDGPFRGYSGVVEEAPSGGELRALVEIFGRATLMVLPLSAVTLPCDEM
jgi:transcription antitermination factor NusG